MEKSYLESWARWVLGDTEMPMICVARMHDMVLGFQMHATGHERLAMIAKYPVMLDMLNIVAWLKETRHLGDPRVAAFFENAPPEKRRELTALRVAIEAFLRKKGF